MSVLSMTFSSIPLISLLFLQIILIFILHRLSFVSLSLSYYVLCKISELFCFISFVQNRFVRINFCKKKRNSCDTRMICDSNGYVILRVNFDCTPYKMSRNFFLYLPIAITLLPIFIKF